MELLQFLLSFLLKQSGEGLEPILSALKNNSFDLKKTLSSITPQMIIPLVQSFMQKAENPQPSYCGGGCGLKPIADIADKDIIYTLNRFFAC